MPSSWNYFLKVPLASRLDSSYEPLCSVVWRASDAIRTNNICACSNATTKVLSFFKQVYQLLEKADNSLLRIAKHRVLGVHLFSNQKLPQRCNHTLIISILAVVKLGTFYSCLGSSSRSDFVWQRRHSQLRLVLYTLDMLRAKFCIVKIGPSTKSFFKLLTCL